MSRVRDISTSWSLKCEVKVLEAKNVALKNPSELFVRCYLSSGNGAAVPINTQRISSQSNNIHWGENFSLECLGDSNLIKTFKQEKVIFELRRKSRTRSVFKRGSKLIGKVEVEWQTVWDSVDMKMERWFPLVLEDVASNAEGLQTPTIHVEMNIDHTERITRSRRRLANLDECGCKYGGCCCMNDELLLVLGASMFEAM